MRPVTSVPETVELQDLTKLPYYSIFVWWLLLTYMPYTKQTWRCM